MVDSISFDFNYFLVQQITVITQNNMSYNKTETFLLSNIIRHT